VDKVSAQEPETQLISMALMIATAVIAVELEVVIPVASEAAVVEDLAAMEEDLVALVVTEAVALALALAAVVEVMEFASSKTSTPEEHLIAPAEKNDCLSLKPKNQQVLKL